MVDKDTSPEVERINREAAAEKRPDDPHAIEPRDARPLMLLACAALAVALVTGVMMWTNTHHDGAGSTPVAEQPAPPAAPQRQL